MRKLSLSVMLLILICWFAACAPLPADPLAYQNEAARLTLEGCIEDADSSLAFEAELTLAVWGGEATSETTEETASSLDLRDFTLVYTAPASLSGLSFTREGGKLTLRRGNVTLTGRADDEHWDAMLAPAMLFCIDCALSDARVLEQDGAMLNRLEVADDEGSYVLYLDAADGNGYPRRIEADFGGRSVSVNITKQKE